MARCEPKVEIVDQLKEALADKVRGEATVFGKPRKYLLQGVPGNVSASGLIAALGRLTAPILDLTVTQNKKGAGFARYVVIRTKKPITRLSFAIQGGLMIPIKPALDGKTPERSMRNPVTAVMSRPTEPAPQDVCMELRITSFPEAVIVTSSKMQVDIECQLNVNWRARFSPKCTTSQHRRVPLTRPTR